jgi:hypothetical protein
MRKILLIMVLSQLVIPMSAPAAPYPGEIIEKIKFSIEQRLREKDFELFIENLGVRESNNKWWITNTIGCIGKWQFSQSTLRELGYKYITPGRFKNDPNIFPEELQRKVLLSLIRMNETILKDYYSYVGQIICGVVITRSGIIASAHLGGAGSVKAFLISGGKSNNHDAYGTSIRNYMIEFAIYNF